MLPHQDATTVPLFRRRAEPLDQTLEKVPDDLPRDGIFTQPLVVAVTAAGPEALDDGELRVTFRATVKDADGKRCPDLHVEATVTGPERTATGATTTDLMGQARFRMAGPAGTYAIRIDDVAGGALDLDPAASTLTAELEVS
ncbi:MAG: Ig-like domain-containing protein [Actinobacteria bacterium]|nr:Ig-like domain-containing protein [Actinomycetota bacterium]